MFDSPRAMAKLLKEAKRVKQVLSANTDHFAQVKQFDYKCFRVCRRQIFLPIMHVVYSLWELWFAFKGRLDFCKICEFVFVVQYGLSA